MSTNLYYHVHKDKMIKTKDCSLKFALRKRFGEPLKNVTLDKTHIEWLHGLIDAGINDADKLFCLISRHGEIIVDESS